MKLSTGMKKALSMFLTAALVVSGVYVSDGKASAAVKEYSLAVTQGQKNVVKVEASNLATEPAFKVVPQKAASGTTFTCAATKGGVEVIATAASNAVVGTYNVDVVANQKKEIEVVKEPGKPEVPATYEEKEIPETATASKSTITVVKTATIAAVATKQQLSQQQRQLQLV